jgi:hypothetical protein
MERGPGISLLIVIGALILGPGLHVYTLTVAAALLAVGPWSLAKLATYDPQFEAIVMRYATYDRVYDPETPLYCYEPFWPSLTTLTGSPLAGPRRPAVPTPREVKK